MRFDYVCVSLVAASCALLTACGGDDGGDDGPDNDCPAASELLAASFSVDSNGDPNDLESSTFIDRNFDDRFDEQDGFDFDGDGVLDDFNGDGRPDNRFYFDDNSRWEPDGDSFDDYENPQLNVPRGRTPVAGDCPADGIETAPLDLRDRDGNAFRAGSRVAAVFAADHDAALPQGRLNPRA